MKKHNYIALFLLFSLSTFIGCIENDVVDDRVTERIAIINRTAEILVGNTHQLTATYTNNVGVEEIRTITWSSTDNSIITVSNTGLITGIKEGTTTIKAEVASDAGATLSESVEIKVSKNATVEPVLESKSGTIVTTSSYPLTGKFTLSEIESSNNLDLRITEYNATTALPGLYVYLSNNPNSINGAFEIGKVTTFNGDHNYTIQNKDINKYTHILYWCKPFSVKVGEGEIK